MRYADATGCTTLDSDPSQSAVNINETLHIEYLVLLSGIASEVYS